MNNTVSKRVERILEPPTRKFLPLVREAEQRGVFVYRLNIGDADIAPPASFSRQINQYQSNTCGYAPSPGIPEHVQAWQTYYNKYHVSLDAHNIIPTAGCAEAIMFSLLAVTDPGDEVIVFEPLYANYQGVAALLNITLVPVPLDSSRGFAIPHDAEIKKRITKKTKAIVVISPNNPTGSVVSIVEQKRLIALAQKYNLYIISDETYREIVFKGKPSSMLQHTSGRNCVIVVDSVSKRFSVPGARIGCVASRNALVMRSILKIAMVRLSAPRIEQQALIPIISHHTAYTQKITREYHKRRDCAIATLRTIPDVTVNVPEGAFYVIARLPVVDSEDFIRFMLTDFSYQHKTTLVTPARNFYITAERGLNEVRIAFVLRQRALRTALDILGKGLTAYRAQ